MYGAVSGDSPPRNNFRRRRVCSGCKVGVRLAKGADVGDGRRGSAYAKARNSKGLEPKWSPLAGLFRPHIICPSHEQDSDCGGEVQEGWNPASSSALSGLSPVPIRSPTSSFGSCRKRSVAMGAQNQRRLGSGLPPWFAACADSIIQLFQGYSRQG